ncbi:ADP-ribosylation factor-like protein 8B [Drepanopeziza brunnea f. sp. 'multigermtubi' MB_m1]|uniref:ADP-ribosylation factor-like protein 8B n=2 Tax=Drepanopeziza brunnea f. sp. 'multigermtubi' TaxID=698441 RepID=K1X617_MARBU|nr:ADP-ribosylation factor-like protein 8B [Drepanopeziza brunnea f. sp. 'multigermtubi' MB_m1]EKD20581.1 ADP-ribosylation factor-like protein 8B [Drepanopeziza brunnea f. sp. 'multigermtubi' MB_m1]
MYVTTFQSRANKHAVSIPISRPRSSKSNTDKAKKEENTRLDLAHSLTYLRGTSRTVMAGLFKRVYDWLLRLFWATEMDITMIGLQNAGKTSLLRVLAGGEFTLDSIPTVGFNMKRVQKGHVTLKCWDLGGQPRFRSMWERYCRGVNAIVFIVDSADTDALPVAKDELHLLLEKPVLEGIPLLVLGNKSDLRDHLSTDELIDALDLKAISHREVSCYGISAKEETNLDAVLQWLVARASK